MALKQVIDYCDQVTTVHNKKREAAVPAGLVKRLGIQSFPAFLHRHLALTVEAAEAEEARGHLEAKAKVTELFKLTIKQVKDDLEDIVFASDDATSDGGSVRSLQEPPSLPPSSSSSLTVVEPAPAPAAVPPPLVVVVKETPVPAKKPAEETPGPLLVSKAAAVGAAKKKTRQSKVQRLDSALMPPEPFDKSIRINLHGTPKRAATVIQVRLLPAWKCHLLPCRSSHPVTPTPRAPPPPPSCCGRPRLWGKGSTGTRTRTW